MGDTNIGILNEKPLHASLKEWYARSGDRLEERVDGYVIDIVRGDLLIEIQTRSFSALKRKLFDLVERHPVRLVHPVSEQKWLVKLPPAGNGQPKRRKSPKRGSTASIFRELVSFPELLAQPNFTVEVLLTHEEEVQRFDARPRWRRTGWVVEERRLLGVVAQHHYEQPADMAAILPEGLPDRFTTADLALGLRQPRRLAQQMAYCLLRLNILEECGKQGRSKLYRRCR